MADSLALDLELAQARIASLEDDVDRYRELALATMDALRAMTLRCDAMRARYDELRDEHQRCREEWLIRSGGIG